MAKKYLNLPVSLCLAILIVINVVHHDCLPTTTITSATAETYHANVPMPTVATGNWDAKVIEEQQRKNEEILANLAKAALALGKKANGTSAVETTTNVAKNNQKRSCCCCNCCCPCKCCSCCNPCCCNCCGECTCIKWAPCCCCPCCCGCTGYGRRRMRKFRRSAEIAACATCGNQQPKATFVKGTSN